MDAVRGRAPGQAETRLALLLRARARRCALPIEDVVETLRPLPLTEVPAAPPYLRGLSVIRGAPVPVLDLGALLGDPPSEAATRFVVLRLGERRAALAVEEVLGLREISAREQHELPPLLQDAGELISRVAARDSELFAVLATARLVPDSVWRTLPASNAE